MAHRKAGGSTQLGRDSQPKYLGVKKFAGEKVKVGQIIVRQRGTKFRPGKNTKRTSDDTIIAMVEGKVKFTSRKVARFTGAIKKARYIVVEQ